MVVILLSKLTMFTRNYKNVQLFILIILLRSSQPASHVVNKKALFSLNEEQPTRFHLVNQSAILKETKENLIRSFGLRENMIDNGYSVKKREPHRYILYLSKEYERRYKKGIVNMANTIRGCTDIGHGKKYGRYPNLSFKFDISEIPKSETLILSEIKILLKPFENSKHVIRHGKFRVTLYGVLPTKQSNRAVLIEVQTKALEITELQFQRWITFDISSFVPGIQGMKKKYIKFVLRVIYSKGSNPIDPAQIGFQGSTAKDTEKALLLLYTGDENDDIKSTSRRKRGVGNAEINGSSPKLKNEKRKRNKDKQRKRKNRKNKNKKKMCRRKTMIVDFQLLGWSNWLLSPTKYNAYYCHGHCRNPLSTYLRPTNHATIQSIVHNMNRDFIPPVCCVPTEFETLPILSLDGEDRVVFKLKTGLIATNCGCR